MSKQLIKIEAKGRLPKDVKITIGGVELKRVNWASISMSPDMLNTVTLQLPVDEIDMELATSGVVIEPVRKDQ